MRRRRRTIPDADRGAPPVPRAPAARGLSRTPLYGAGGDENLVVGYPSAVAAAFVERGIAVATLHPDGPGGDRPGPGVLCGTLNLRTDGVGRAWRWVPTQVDWHPGPRLVGAAAARQQTGT